jgi:hypothetical protein
MEQETWLEEVRARQAEINTRHKKIVRDALEAAERVIKDSGGPDFYLIDDLAKTLVAKSRRKRHRPLRGKDIFDTGIPSKQVDIEIRGRQSLLAGDIRVKGWLLEVVDDRHIIIKIPKINIGGWTMKGGGTCRKKQRAG